MIILRKESPILYAEINNLSDSFYEEISLEKAPEEVRNYIENGGELSGAGVRFSDDYFWSNTNGITYGKVFKKVGDGLKFKPIYDKQCLNLNDTRNIDDLASFLPEETLFEVRYSLDERYDILSIGATHVFPKEDLICEDQSWRAEYKELFRGRHCYWVSAIGVKGGVTDEEFEERGLDNPIHPRMTLSQFRQHLIELEAFEEGAFYMEMKEIYYRPTAY